jgi:trk system potassium uptake protein TrkA
MTLDEAGFTSARDKYGIATIALKRGDEIILSPDSEEKLRDGDVLVVAGRDEYINQITN